MPSRILGLVLLVITFSLGILLAMTIGEKNVAEQALTNARATIKQQDIKIKDESDQKEQARQDFSGCKAELMKQNTEASTQAFAAEDAKRAADARVEITLAGLPAAIAKDRQPLITGQGPALATRWVQELFK